MLSLVVSLPLIAILIHKYLLIPYFLSPLAKIPNAHITSPLSTRWIDHKRRTGKEVLTIYALHRKHGPVVRLAPRELSVNSLHGLRVVYTGAFEKHPQYRDMFVNFHTDNLVGMIPNAPHAQQKRMISRIYSKSYLQESPDVRVFSATILAHRLLPILHNLAQTNNTTTNVLPLFQAVGMDFTSSYLFGIQNATNYLLNLPLWEQWLAEYEQFKNLSLDERANGFIEKWCLSLCQRVQNQIQLPRSSTLPEPTEALEALTTTAANTTISTTVTGITTTPVVYNQLYNSLQQTPSDPRPIHLAVASELLDHLVAGHETSGIVFTYIMWELSQRPELQSDLRQELRSSLNPQLLYPFPLASVSPPSSLPDLPSPASIDALPLLDAIVRETLRLHTPVPGPLPRLTPHLHHSDNITAASNSNTIKISDKKPKTGSQNNGTSINGYDSIPGGIRISSSAYTLHRIEEVYPRPSEWLPQRWLDPTPNGNAIHNMRRLFWAFGSGGRMCLGSNFALQEIKLVIAAVYTNYTTSIVDDKGIEQALDEFIALPKSRKLILKFTHLNS